VTGAVAAAILALRISRGRALATAPGPSLAMAGGR
jgi:hypothetical protein